MTTEKILLENGSIVLLEDGADLLLETVIPPIGPPVQPPIIIHATPQTIDLLDLTNVGVRADTFRFDLLDPAHNTIGKLAVNLDQAPHVTLDTSRSVARTLTGLSVCSALTFNDPNYIALEDIDVRHSRVRPMLVLENGAEFPLGVFMFGDDNRNDLSWGTAWSPALFDEMFLIDQYLLDADIGIPPGASVLSLVIALLAPVGIPVLDFTGVTDVLAQTALSYKAGSSRTQALIALAGILGCYPPFIDNVGDLRIKPAPASGAPPDHRYGSNTRVIEGSVKTTNSAYRAPNRYQVVSGDATGSIIGIYDLPSTSPNSYDQTGVRVTASQSVSGIPTTDLANLAAYINALKDGATAYTQASFESTVDPRHDVFDLVQLNGTMYSEVSWDIECSSGGIMQHGLSGYFG